MHPWPGVFILLAAENCIYPKYTSGNCIWPKSTPVTAFTLNTLRVTVFTLHMPWVTPFTLNIPLVAEYAIYIAVDLWYIMSLLKCIHDRGCPFSRRRNPRDKNWVTVFTLHMPWVTPITLNIPLVTEKANAPKVAGPRTCGKLVSWRKVGKYVVSL